MNLTFIEDHQSYRTGNTAYKRGDEATFARHGTYLVLNGIAKEGWGHKLEPVAEKSIPAVDVSGLSVVELKDLAKAAAVSGYTKMKKAELIEALS